MQVFPGPQGLVNGNGQRSLESREMSTGQLPNFCNQGG